MASEIDTVEEKEVTMDCFMKNILDTFAESVIITFCRDGREKASGQCKRLNDDILGRMKEDKRSLMVGIVKAKYAEHLDKLDERIAIFERLIAKSKTEKEEFEKMVKEICVN